MLIQYQPSFGSNVAHIVKRILSTALDDFWLILLITVILTAGLTWLYYTYAVQFIRAEAIKILKAITFRKPKPAEPQPAKQQMYRKHRTMAKKQRKQYMKSFE